MKLSWKSKKRVAKEKHDRYIKLRDRYRRIATYYNLEAARQREIAYPELYKINKSAN